MQMGVGRIKWLRLAGFGGTGLSLALFVFIARMVDAERIALRRTSASFDEATKIAPEDWEIYDSWAQNLLVGRLEHLRTAAVLNPLNPNIRLEIAAAAEAAKRYDEAESSLKAAIAVSGTSDAPVALAEFYFRQKDEQHFWQAARAALLVSADLPTSLVQDCWQLTSDPNKILQTVVSADRPKQLLGYFQFLLEQNQSAALPPLASIIMGKPLSTWQAIDGMSLLRNLMLSYCEQLINQRSVTASVEIWNWLAQNRIILYGNLNSRAGSWLINSDFKTVPLSAAFDWRPESNEDVFIDYSKTPRSLRISFSGKQPEHCEVLAQYVPLYPGHRYLLTVHYQTSDQSMLSGLEWRMDSAAGVKVVEVKAVNHGGPWNDPASDEGKLDRSYSIIGPSAATLGRLTLAYDRVPGTVRTEGDVEIRGIEATIE